MFTTPGQVSSHHSHPRARLCNSWAVPLPRVGHLDWARPSVDRHSGCFCVAATISDAATDRTVVVPAFCRRSFSRILGKSSVWSRWIVWYIYVHILRKCTCFPAWLSLFTSPPATCLAPASPHPHQHLAQSDFVTRALPVQV